MKSSARNIKLASVDDLFQSSDIGEPVATGQPVQLPIEKLHGFRLHPFHVRQDEEMDKLVQSVQEHGVLMPVLVRPDGDEYEIISGHRRVEACKIAGITEVPVTIREMDDETATILMVDSNLRQREKLLPSEKAFAYRMKLEAIKKQSGTRTDLTSGQVGQRLKTSRDNIAENSDDSSKQIARFIRLTYLIPPFLDMVDTGKIAFNPAVSVSYLPETDQSNVLQCLHGQDIALSQKQADRLKQFGAEGNLSLHVIEAIFGEEKPQLEKISIRADRLRKYFSANATFSEMEETIVKALEAYRQKAKGRSYLKVNPPSTHHVNSK